MILKKHNLLAIFIWLLSVAGVSAQCPANLSVSNGATGTWVNTSSGTATVRITAIGGGGGKNTATPNDGQVNTLQGGAGATIIGTFTVAPGASIFVVAGEQGANATEAGGGGGASGAVNCGNPANCATGTILLIAGGGGGTSGYVDGGGGKASSGGGGGGSSPETAGGGGGLNAPGANGLNGATGGGQVNKSAISAGGTAGVNNTVSGAAGGDGMGGGGGTDGSAIAGGGGGQTGGDSESLSTPAYGGNSYNSGTNPTNIAGADGASNGAGSVLVECLSVMPVEIVSFAAKSHQTSSIMLTWQTASEHDNEGFEVERSLNGAVWSNLGFVQGQNTGTIYSFNDDKPSKGENYYRLRQVDLDGRYNYSSVVTARIEGADGGRLELYPNPSQGAPVHLIIPDAVEEDVEVKLLAPTGQLIRFMTLQGGQHLIDTGELPPGVYTVQAWIGGVLESYRFVLN